MGVIRSHLVTSGTREVPRLTTTDRQEHSNVAFSTTGLAATELAIFDQGLPAVVTTQNLISLTIEIPGQPPSVWTPAVFGAAGGAGSGTGAFFIGATNVIERSTPRREFLVTYGTQAERDAAAGIPAALNNFAEVEYETQAFVAPIAGTETTLDATEGGTLRAMYRAGTSELVHPSRYGDVTYTINHTPGTPDPANDVTIPATLGSLIPGNARVDNFNLFPVQLVIES